jgi:membrane protease YdiL (CAAX protease family)
VLLHQDTISIVAFLLLAFVLSFVFTWLFNGSGGSLIPVMLFHATQNSEEIFEVLFPSLVGTD